MHLIDHERCYLLKLLQLSVSVIIAHHLPHIPAGPIATMYKTNEASKLIAPLTGIHNLVVPDNQPTGSSSSVVAIINTFASCMSMVSGPVLWVHHRLSLINIDCFGKLVSQLVTPR